MSRLTFPRFPAPLLILPLWWALALTSQAQSVDYEEAYAGLHPRDAAAASQRSENPGSLQHRLMCGYQGWFSAPGDGSGIAWNHYTDHHGRFEPGHCSIDLWPDVLEFDDDEKFETPFRHAGGSPAYTFSSQHPKTVDRHFRWMADYGIDGVFLQRFASEASPRHRDYLQLRRTNTVLPLARDAANAHGRAWALMYDLTGVTGGDMPRVFRDWKKLRTRMNVGLDPNDKSYLHHHGKPLVAVWGIGFSDDAPRPSLDQQAEFLRFLKHNPEWGGFSLMVGVPTGWRTLDRDAVTDPSLHEILTLADVISPWTVGRYADNPGVTRHREQNWNPDLAWCRERNIDYLPVVFPGFSWHNLHHGEKPLAEIPRQKGAFFWHQIQQAHAAGAQMLYVAMFDEIDEATAIFKCTNTPPIGASKFLTYENLPTDHYLRLCGNGARLLKGAPLHR